MAQQDANIQRSKEAKEKWESRRTEIIWLYETQEFSTAKIAKYYGVSTVGMQQAMKRMGIPMHPRSNSGKRNGRYIDGSQSTLYRLMIQKDFCVTCGATERLVIHHKNGNHQDNHLENLQVLCDSCHNSLTKGLWWKAHK